MTNNKNKVLIAVLTVAAVIGVIYFISGKRAVAPIVPLSGSDLVERKDACYFKETVGEFEGTPVVGYQFVSVNYDTGDEAHGIINWIPAEKDSLVGVYTGMVEKNENMEGYPWRLNVVYAGLGEGVVSYQQEIILMGENDIKIGSGERYLDTDGLYKFKDVSDLAYGAALPKTDCLNVPENIRADYSISK